MKDVIVKDDIGNIIKTKKYNYNITVGGKYAHEVFTFKMPDTDVFIYGVMSDPIQYYKINTGPSIPEGVLDISHQSAKEGTMVKVEIDVTKGFKWNELLVTDKFLNLIELKKIGDNVYTFYMPASDVTIEADIYGSDPYEIKIEDGAPTIDFADLTHLAETVVLEDAKTRYLLMQVSHYEEGNVPADDKDLIKGKASELGAGAGNWFDISMYICSREDDSRIGSIPKPDKPIELKAKVPEDLRKEGRTYYLIGIKDGKAQVYAETTDTEFKWESDTFGTYVIAYKDAGQASGTDPSKARPAENRSGAASSANVTRVTGGSSSATKASSAGTGDRSHMPAFIAIAAAGAAGIVGAFVARIRKKD